MIGTIAAFVFVLVYVKEVFNPAMGWAFGHGFYATVIVFLGGIALAVIGGMIIGFAPLRIAAFVRNTRESTKNSGEDAGN